MSYIDDEAGRIRVISIKTKKKNKQKKLNVLKGIPYNMRETEASIVICSDNPERVAAQIAQLESIADHPLVSSGSKKIIDTYFDTNQKVLEKKRIAIRLREVNGEYWVAVKGPSLNGIPNVDRSENEFNWSQLGKAKIIDYLKTNANVKGLQLGRSNSDLIETEPLKVLQETGLVIVQRRENFRESRNILSKNSSHKVDQVLAELDIDHVVYHFNFRDVSLYNIEIEQREATGNLILNTIVDELISIYGPDTFKKWNYGKLALGKGIEKLHRDNTLKGMMINDNTLRREAYDKIEEFIRNEEV
jgi:hypothetical protein